MFTQMESHGAERLLFASDPESGLKAIIAIHSTLRGPAIGGCRFLSYQHEQDAVTDALRLARGMSYKSALAGLPHGGAKAVVMEPQKHYDRGALMRSFGRFVDSIGGDYITAMDSGTQTGDMDQIRHSTRWVSCTSDSGDPSPYTALGVFEGIKASVRFKLNRESLKGIHIAIQGLGHVGYDVARLLHQAGAKLTVSDISSERAKRCQRDFSAAIVAPEEIYDVAADLFCPCGLGAILNADTIARLKVSIIAGSANNQLASSNDGELIHQRGILYAPDYLINSGGLIFVAMQYAGKSRTAIRNKVSGIPPMLLQLYQEASQTGEAVHQVADKQAELILQQSKDLHSAA